MTKYDDDNYTIHKSTCFESSLGNIEHNYTRKIEKWPLERKIITENVTQSYPPTADLLLPRQGHEWYRLTIFNSSEHDKYGNTG